MATELTDILKAAAEVRDETAMQQNTATRVGGVLTDLAQFVGEAVFAAGMTAKTSAAGVSLLIKYYDADGQPYTKELPLPVAACYVQGLSRLRSWLTSIQPTATKPPRGRLRTRNCCAAYRAKAPVPRPIPTPASTSEASTTSMPKTASLPHWGQGRAYPAKRERRKYRTIPWTSWCP